MRRSGIRLLQLLATVVVTLFIFRQVGVSVDGLRGLEGHVWRPDVLPFLGASGVLVLGYFGSALLWGRMVQELGGPSLGAFTSVRIYMVSNLGRYVPGKIWQIAGMALLARRMGVTPAVSAGAAILGQGVALAGASVVGALAFSGAEGQVRWLGLVLLVGVLAFLVITGVPVLFRRVVQIAYRLARQVPPADLLVNRSFGIRWLALYALNWAVYAGAFWGLARSLRLELTLVEAAPAFAAAYVLGYAALFAPAGVGVREGFLVAFLQPMVGTGAVVLAVVARLWTTVVEVVPALLLALAGPPALAAEAAGEVD